jgi:hypothetical protein
VSAAGVRHCELEDNKALLYLENNSNSNNKDHPNQHFLRQTFTVELVSMTSRNACPIIGQYVKDYYDRLSGALIDKTISQNISPVILCVFEYGQVR